MTDERRAVRPERAGLLLAAAVVAAGIVFRFWTRSPLSLSEAITVNLATLPLGRLPGALRHDVSPPLWPAMLHVWIAVVGRSPAAVRALSGVISVATLPVIAVATRRLAPPVRRSAGAIAAVLLLASSPFAVRFATDAGPYALTSLLVALLFLSVGRAFDTGARPISLLAVALTVAALVLTHYWGLIVAAVGAAIVAASLWGEALARRRDAARILAAMAVGLVAFVPWVPTFVHQILHAGTPWQPPASFRALVDALAAFAGARSAAGRGLGLLLLASAAFGLLGTPLDRLRIRLDLRTRPEGRVPAAAAAGIVVIAFAASLAARTAVADRYAAAVLPPFLVLAALGLTVLVDRRIFAGALAASAVLGFVSCYGNVNGGRTQAGVIASALRKGVMAGDVVGYCPEPLGPPVARLLPRGITQLSFASAADDPRLVRWDGYSERAHAGDPTAFAVQLDRRAGSHAVWLVWGSDYRLLGHRCEQAAQELTRLRPTTAAVVAEDPGRYFEYATLYRSTR